MKDNTSKLKNLIYKPKHITITTHKGPDGDAIGSSLAMLHLLKQLGHCVNVITPNSYADFLHWIPGNEEVIIFEENLKSAKEIVEKSDIIFFLDFSNLSRISSYDISGNFFPQIINDSSATKILIDHHQDPNMEIADIIFSDTEVSSTAQMIYEIICEMGLGSLFNKEIAECLYLGIMTDTGSFKYSSTTAKTHNVIADLIKLGADNTKIHDLIYDKSSPNKIKLLGYCLNEKLLLYPENNAAIISLTAKELKKFNYQKGDTEGMVNYALSIKGITFAVFLVEKDEIVKLSLRSKGDFKVNEIAKKYFSGGGHMNASGGISSKSLNDTIIQLEKIIKNIN